MSDADKNKYDDIIHLPHHVSTTHPQMSMENRAAQFAPFAALTGHKEEVREAGRYTERRIELDEDEQETLDRRLQYIRGKLSKGPEIAVTYFLPDERKEGGRYVTERGVVKKIDEYRRCFVMEGGMEIPVRDITNIRLQEEIE